ncbi:MAG: hypothetical protein P4M11_15765 [Candidatus Pacebacteria bacterium]|nr:hypothetical protein [Candidatus Paceibacterota bacterium]
MEAICKLFGKFEKLKGSIPRVMRRYGGDKKDKPEMSTGKSKAEALYALFISVKKSLMVDKDVKRELKQEFKNFCEILLKLVVDAEEEDAMSTDRLFIGKLIEYIGHSGSSADVDTHTVKYLLSAFTSVIDMSGKIGLTDKERKKSQKQVLVSG